MPYFQCRFAFEDGHIASQSILAPSKRECRKHFESEGYCILSIKRDWKRIQIPLLPFEKKIKDKDFIMFNQELVALIRAGYPILKCLEIISSRTKNLHLKELLMRIESEVRAGKALSDAFSAHGDTFSTVYIASLMAGERSGNLPDTLKRYILYHRIILRTKTRMRRAMTYPSLLFLLSFGLMLIIIYFIIPRFADFYQDFEAQLPAVTTALVKFSNFMRDNFLWILAAAAAGMVGLTALRHNQRGQILLDQIKLKIPYGRKILLDSSVALFTRTLGLLLEGGIALISSLEIARKSVPNRFLQLRAQNLPDMIKNGENLSDSLNQAGFFDPLALDMIRIGESSANLEGMLGEVAEVFDERIQNRIDTFVTLIEPLVMVFMGLIVAIMLLSVYVPIFNIIKVTR